MSTPYLAFLRAVNVGGRTLKMEHLRTLLGELGLEDVGTYIQTGNAYFHAPADERPGLAQRIETHLEAATGFAVPVALRTVDEVEAIVARAPFADVAVDEHTRCSVLFATGPLPTDLDLPLVSPKGDIEVIEVIGDDAIVVLRQQPGRPVNPGTFLDKALGVPSTARFFHTTEKIAAAARKHLGGR